MCSFSFSTVNLFSLQQSSDLIYWETMCGVHIRWALGVFIVCCLLDDRIILLYVYQRIRISNVICEIKMLQNAIFLLSWQIQRRSTRKSGQSDWHHITKGDIDDILAYRGPVHFAALFANSPTLLPCTHNATTRTIGGTIYD